MSVLLVRHGLSAANGRNSAAFGDANASLLPEGLIHGENAGTFLRISGIDTTTERAAASGMRRSKETAAAAGFTAVSSYDLLNEVNLPVNPELRAILDREEIVQEARDAAERVIANPPAERVWFSHGYLIAALCKLTEIDTSGMRFIPHFGEIRELDI
ncbi:MAG: histidine phosphatase family protein [Patescibacteria group bacterium]|nr:histidine phosphatase family protein [Patescibacteria group bacterium]